MNCATVRRPLDCRVASAPRDARWGNARWGNDKRGNDWRRQGQNGHRNEPLVLCQLPVSQVGEAGIVLASCVCGAVTWQRLQGGRPAWVCGGGAGGRELQVRPRSGLAVRGFGSTEVAQLKFWGLGTKLVGAAVIHPTPPATAPCDGGRKRPGTAIGTRLHHVKTERHQCSANFVPGPWGGWAQSG